jgi:hypothetical protein
MEPKIESHVTKQILKVKIKKEEVFISFTETTHIIRKNPDTLELISEDKFVSNHDVTGRFLPHGDFTDAFKMLRKPVIDLTEQGNFNQFDRYTIKGISLSGMDSDEDARVVITASKKLEHNTKPFNFNTPAATLFNEEEYADAEKLDGFVKKICDEAWLYLGGKHSVNPQMSLEFQDGTKKTMEVKEDKLAIAK